MKSLLIAGVDISHSRLVDLAKLADQAKPFYDWIEARFQKRLTRDSSLDEILRTASKAEIKAAILDCYAAEGEANLPLLFDGVGRSYLHVKACYYMFAWLIRDAPQQRLAPLIQRIVRVSRKYRLAVEAEALAALIVKYRNHVKTFEWQAVREVILERLEGSRRSLKGHEREIVVRMALLTAIQTFFAENGNYGQYSRVELAEKEVMIGNELFDVVADLFETSDKSTQRILVSLKTRETEGGGHAHLFTRDLKSALRLVKSKNARDFLIAVIVAKNWSDREKDAVRQLVDHTCIFDLDPNEFGEFSQVEQEKLNSFVAALLRGEIVPKAGN